MHQSSKPAELAYDDLLMQVESLSYRYPDGTQALTGTDLQLRVGDRLALVGHNGSGKTTLVKQLCGLLQPIQENVPGIRVVKAGQETRQGGLA